MEDVNMEENILNAIQHIRSKCKKRVTSQIIYSFVNKGALFLESNSFQDFMIGLEIDGYICKKRGKGKSASYFVRNKFSSIEKNENSNNGISMQQNVRFSSPQTIEKARKDIKKKKVEVEGIQKNTPLLNRYGTPPPRNHERKTESSFE